MSIDKYYRQTALDYHRTHVNGPELAERRHVLPQLASALIALGGLVVVAYLFVDRLPLWRSVDITCESGHVIAKDLPPNSSRIVYRLGSESAVSDLSRTAAGSRSGAADFELSQGSPALCGRRKTSSIKAVVR